MKKDCRAAVCCTEEREEARRMERHSVSCSAHRTREYSKRLLTGLVIAWFGGLVYGMVFCFMQWCVTPDNTAITELLTYIGAPMSCGVVGYLVKSAMENRIKLCRGEDGAVTLSKQSVPGYDVHTTELD